MSAGGQCPAIHPNRVVTLFICFGYIGIESGYSGSKRCTGDSLMKIAIEQVLRKLHIETAIFSRWSWKHYRNKFTIQYAAILQEFREHNTMSTPYRAASIIHNARTSAQNGQTGNNIDPELVISIDFGTTYTGVAYVFLPSLSNRRGSLSQAEVQTILDNLVVISRWPTYNTQTSAKTPSALAYENGQRIAWGGRVKSTHAIQVRHFKLGLQDDIKNRYNGDAPVLLGDFLNNSNWRHEQLPDKSAWDYTVDYLTAVVSHVFSEVLPAHFGPRFLENQKKSYVLTVPAIWTDKAKDVTRRAAVKAGIPESKLVLVTEPEAAGLYCATMCTQLDLREGDRYIICDAGGGTVVTRS